MTISAVVVAVVLLVSVFLVRNKALSKDDTLFHEFVPVPKTREKALEALDKKDWASTRNALLWFLDNASGDADLEIVTQALRFPNTGPPDSRHRGSGQEVWTRGDAQGDRLPVLRFH